VSNTAFHFVFKRIPTTFLLIALMLMTSCSKTTIKAEGVSSKGIESDTTVVVGESNSQNLDRKTVTFIELGSVNCIPCKAMQPIMRDVENRYGDQVKVVFYDVWTEKGRPYGSIYRIRVIPTQVFLDRDGKEYHRHEGYFPFEELLKILEKGGVEL
jgi:thioredoxin 1